MALYCISVREKQGADILHDLLGNTVEVVLDPTLLMGINEWKEIAKPYTNKKKKYVFAYTLAVSDTIMKFTKGLSKEKGIDLILISDNMWKRHDAIYAKAVSPEEFIDLFYNASYVVTNSFHGTAFSINLNKQFFIELPPPPSTRNSRMENILDLFSLRDRLIINGKNEHKNDSIDYESLNRKMEKERRKSIEVLKRIIKEEAV